MGDRSEKGVHRLPGRHTPEDDARVHAARCQQPAIGRERRAGHDGLLPVPEVAELHCRVAAERVHQPVRRRIPETRRAVPAAGHQPATIPREGDALDVALMSRQPIDRLVSGRGKVPKPHRPVHVSYR
jgi:hypothetical protein